MEATSLVVLAALFGGLGFMARWIYAYFIVDLAITTPEQRRNLKAPRERLGLKLPAHTWTEQFFTSSRGVTIYTQTWVPKDVAPKGVVLYQHGYNDSAQWMVMFHVELYLLNGFTVICCELEGCGYSDGKVSYHYDFHGMVDDVLEYFEKEAMPKFPDLPRILMGESLGGGVAVCAALKKPELFDAMVLYAPMCRIADHVRPPLFIQNFLIKLADLFPTLPVTPSKIAVELSVKCPERLALAKQNPFGFSGLPRLRTAVEMLKATDYIEANMHNVKVPMLICHGKADIVTDPSCSILLHERSENSDSILNLYDDMWHCLIAGSPEHERDEVAKDVIKYLNEVVDKHQNS